MEDTDGITALLDRVSAGDSAALEELLPRVYEDLRAMAGRMMRREGPGHTLQPTALVHESYLRLVGQSRVKWQGRAHFLGVAAQAMRRVLVDHARATRSEKRGGGSEQPGLPELSGQTHGSSVELLDLENALTLLEHEEPRKAHVVELLYFGGLTAQEAGELLGVTARTVERDWRYARAWLFQQLTGES